MSETLGVDTGIEEAPLIWRVKKAPDDSLYGPVDVETLKEWANSAQIAPEDMVDEGDDNWRRAPEIDFLEMLWLVKLPGGQIYGHRPRWAGRFPACWSQWWNNGRGRWPECRATWRSPLR